MLDILVISLRTDVSCGLFPGPALKKSLFVCSLISGFACSAIFVLDLWISSANLRVGQLIVLWFGTLKVVGISS